MLPDRVSNPGPLTYESGALPIALRGPADGKKFINDQIGNICSADQEGKTRILVFLKDS